MTGEDPAEDGMADSSSPSGSVALSPGPESENVADRADVPPLSVDPPHVTGGAVIKRSVRIAGHPTSVSLEEAFWSALRGIAADRHQSVGALISEIDAVRMTLPHGGNLSSVLRVYVLQWFRRATLHEEPDRKQNP